MVHKYITLTGQLHFVRPYLLCPFQAEYWLVKFLFVPSDPTLIVIHLLATFKLVVTLC
jgi:hypothetical protein